MARAPSHTATDFWPFASRPRVPQRCLAWSAESRFIASGGEDLCVFVWDLLSERIVLQLPRARDWLCSVAFSEDNKWLACCGFGSSCVALHSIEVIHDQGEDDTSAPNAGA